jgi:hypothetical protein
MHRGDAVARAKRVLTLYALADPEVGYCQGTTRAGVTGFFYTYA